MSTSNFETLVNTHRLAWNVQTRTFSCCASDLGWPVGHFPGIVHVQSHKTNAVKTFQMVSHEKDNEGDLVSIRYETYNIALVVYND